MHLRTAGPIAGLLLLVLGAAAQPATPPSLEQARLGFPGGPDAGRSRNGAWAPVYLTLKGGAEGNGQNTYQVSLQTTDSEGAPSRVTVPVPALAANDQRTLIGYVRPGSDGSDLNVQLETTGGQPVQTLPRIQRDASTFKNEIVLPHQVFYLTLGARLAGLRRAGKEAPKPAKENKEEDEDEVNEGDRRSFGFIESVDGMPDQWFGYEAVDVVVLTTGKDDFVKKLLEDGAAPQRLALLEWVRRGGRLVLSVGRNHQLVAPLLKKMPLERCTIDGSVMRSSLRNVAFWTGRGADKALRGRDPREKVQVANLKPGPHDHVLIREEAEGRDPARPVLVQASCGLGRVIMAAFDLDETPFSTWDGQQDFWIKMQGEIAPLVPVQHNAGGFGGSESRELANETKRILETFEEVPVISFGWVALFILVYIIIVGPLDYFILKKVFKRLELTWITFPAVVLIVSVAAYCLAYSLKGDDIRINKIDVVDIDLGEPQRAYGTSWFALFSPRIQSYTVGLEPAAPEWAAPAVEGQRPAVMVATLDTPEQVLGSTGQGLFRRPYDYAADAAGIQRMPIPVWATRSFTASWEAPLPAGQPPIEAKLWRSRDGAALVGEVRSHLTLDLHEVVLFYRGKGYKLGDLAPGASRPVNALFERGVQPLEPPAWLSEESLRPRLSSLPSKQQSRSWYSWSSYRLMKPLMFYAETGGNGQYNSNLRRLDQSWRLEPQTEVPTPVRPHYREEVVLVARTAVLADRAEQVTRDGVASRLWLDALPGGTTPRPSLPGYLTQETYVRVYVPVQGSP